VRTSSPHRVGVEVAKRHVGQAGVLGGADAVFDAGAGAVLALQGGDVGAGLVGEDGLEAVAVVVGERQLGARMGTLAAHEHPRALRPPGQVERLGDLGDLAVVARLVVLVERGRPRVLL
jgi:hypothetical protein